MLNHPIYVGSCVLDLSKLPRFPLQLYEIKVSRCETMLHRYGLTYLVKTDKSVLCCHGSSCYHNPKSVQFGTETLPALAPKYGILFH